MYFVDFAIAKGVIENFYFNMIVCFGSNKKSIGFILARTVVFLTALLAYTVSFQYSNTVNNNILVSLFFAIFFLMIWVIVVSLVHNKGEMIILKEGFLFKEMDEFSLEEKTRTTIYFENIKAYSISYPTATVALLKFWLTDGTTHNYHLKRKIYFNDQNNLDKTIFRIHKTIDDYNARVGFDTIKRRFSFFASKLGLLVVSSLTVCVFLMLLFLLKGTKGWLGLPVFLSFVFMAIQQRQNELNDYKKNHAE